MADRVAGIRVAVMACLPVIVAGCISVRPVEGPVRLGQIAAVNGPRVRPDHVSEDSRCPKDAQCVWAGRLIVRVTVLGGGWSKRIDLTQGIPVNVADGSLVLVKATPSRKTSVPLDASPSYRFTFAFQGGL